MDIDMLTASRRCEVGGLCIAPAAARETRRLLLVDDHEMVRVGMRSLFSQLHGVTIEWIEAASLQEAIERYAADARIDAVLLDLNLADAKGLQGLRQFRAAHPGSRIAVFSATQDEFVIRQARALGAVAYLCKGASAVHMQQALGALLDCALRGTAEECTGLARALFPPLLPPLFPRFAAAPPYDRVAELGPRHLEILELVLSGCTNQEISDATKLSIGTVKNYVSSLLLALDVRSRSHMISLFQ